MKQSYVWLEFLWISLSTVWYVFTVLWLNLFCHELFYHTCKANSSLQMFCSCPPQNLLRKWFRWFRFNLKNPPLNLVQQQSVWYILAVLWQDFGCHELFSTDISMHLKKRSVEGALCVESGVYLDIFNSRIYYHILWHIDNSITNEKKTLSFESQRHDFCFVSQKMSV